MILLVAAHYRSFRADLAPNEVIKYDCSSASGTRLIYLSFESRIQDVFPGYHPDNKEVVMISEVRMIYGWTVRRSL